MDFQADEINFIPPTEKESLVIVACIETNAFFAFKTIVVH